MSELTKRSATQHSKLEMCVWVKVVPDLNFNWPDPSEPESELDHLTRRPEFEADNCKGPAQWSRFFLFFQILHQGQGPNLLTTNFQIYFEVVKFPSPSSTFSWSLSFPLQEVHPKHSTNITRKEKVTHHLKRVKKARWIKIISCSETSVHTPFERYHRYGPVYHTELENKRMALNSTSGLCKQGNC